MKLKRFTILLLIPVLACMICLPAFASSPFPIEAQYDNGRFVVEATANISRYSTSGTVATICNETIAEYHYAKVSYKYHTYDEENPVVTDSKTNTRYSSYAHVSFSNSSILTMQEATYTFKADVPTSHGTQRFNVNPTTIVY